MRSLICVGLVWALTSYCLCADQVDAFIILYLQTREAHQEFQWGRVDAVGKDEVATRLREVVDGKRDTIGFGHIVTQILRRGC